MTGPRPQLYWISGSPPAWRVMLALTLKGIAFENRQLDHGAGENRAPEYLKLNPKGQVPTLVIGDLVIRESIAILAWLDRAYTQRPIWSATKDDAAQVWQDVMEMEAVIRAPVTATAQALLRGTSHDPTNLASLADACDEYASRLAHQPFLGGDSAMASDIWLYPALHWIARGTALAGPKAPEICTSLTSSRPALADWMDRFRAVPGVADTYPPHWRT
ncbi:glutathione S-transferase family protein [Cognatiyoonia sp. IB215446]|uniref:glutathione S-transferase family protein n=1 Tax=Cognatiyoonia sp. IB215446 TaxID=3097355 RepID=UPI002A1233FB|nr:glutathione S-transferase family protein [Cognatiyoonia sp. IB215446]MDX8350654.1 glutathione S-transferase family protein [Cognatiyoonia sp. IB215446]